LEGNPVDHTINVGKSSQWWADTHAYRFRCSCGAASYVHTRKEANKSAREHLAQVEKRAAAEVKP
jgi:hypothetical protein